MTINTNAQWKLVSTSKVGFADVAGQAAVHLGQLPAGAVLDDIEINITTGFDGTTPSFGVELQEISDNSQAQVLAAAVVSSAAGRQQGSDLTAVAATPAAYNIVVTPNAGMQAATVGEMTIHIPYFIVGRTNESMN